MDPHTRHLFAFPLESDEYRMPIDGQFRVYRSTNAGRSWDSSLRALASGENTMSFSLASGYWTEDAEDEDHVGLVARGLRGG